MHGHESSEGAPVRCSLSISSPARFPPGRRGGEGGLPGKWSWAMPQHNLPVACSMAQERGSLWERAAPPPAFIAGLKDGTWR